jgi:hypothetical protein
MLTDDLEIDSGGQPYLKIVGQKENVQRSTPNVQYRNQEKWFSFCDSRI